MEERTIRREQLEPTAGFRRMMQLSLWAGGFGLAAAVFFGYTADSTLRRFFFAYLVSFTYFLSISLGALFFVMLQHLTRAGWSVGVRRSAENLAAAIPLLAVLAAPILLSVLVNPGGLYPWAHHMAAEGGAAEEPLANRWFLNSGVFIVSMLICFGTWSWLGIWFRRLSVKQDDMPDARLTMRMQGVAAPGMVVLALTLTIAAIAMLMSLDPEWSSTMFGVYFFSGSAVAIFASLIVIVAILQSAGYLTRSITIEHFHDLGKFLFAFVFFWGYIAFSQFMLLWYANIPEETGWFVRHGASSVDINGWTVILLVLLAGHLILPFAGLLSRHVKRTRGTLIFWAGWLLIFHWIDLYWLIMPQFDEQVHVGIVDLACLIGIGGVYVAAVIKIAMQNDLRPVGDPRLVESLTFENI
ncbi:MAG TPA: hypothetical protein VHD56_10265 [Tepidisphaeraceae bacterium]|nr:hypothetical protein [Tepidisphaeraceae bacterium]